MSASERLALLRRYNRHSRQQQSCKGLLAQMDPEDLHVHFTPEEWGNQFHTSVGWPSRSELFEIESLSLMGLMACRLNGSGFSQAASELPCDWTRCALRLTERVSGRRHEISAIAHIVAIGGDFFAARWTEALADPANRPHSGWDSARDLKSALDLLEVSQRRRGVHFKSTLLRFLREAPQVDPADLARIAPASARGNRALATLLWAEKDAPERMGANAHTPDVAQLADPIAFAPAPGHKGLLHLYAEHGNCTALLKLLEAGHDPSHRDGRGMTPQQVAAFKQQADAEQLLRAWSARQRAQAAASSLSLTLG